MSAPIVIAPGAGEVVGDSPERRVEILSDDDSLHATWSRFGPGREGADLHIHRRHTDLFYVLSGELTLRLGLENETVAAGAGTLARVPAFVVHGFRNAGDGDVTYLNLHAPGQGFAGFLRGLRDGAAVSYDQEPPPAEGIRAAREAVVGRAEPLEEQRGWRASLLAGVEAIALAEVSVERSRPAVAPHVHDRHLESLYVLEGELAVTGAEGELRAPAGSWVRVPAGAPHAVSPTGAGPTRYLELHTPNCGFASFMRSCAELGDEELAAANAGFDLRRTEEIRA